MIRVLTLPAISEVPTDITVLRIHAAVGDALLKDQPFLDIATDKIDLEIPAPYDLKVSAVHVVVGEQVQTGAKLMTVITREDGESCANREELVNVVTGLRYIATRNPQFICCRSSLGQYRFEDLEPFVRITVSLSQAILRADLDSLDQVAIENLRDTLYQITQHITRMESLDVKSTNKAVDHAFILRNVVESQDVMLSRLFRAEAHARGESIDRAEEVRRASAIYNAGRAYVFVSYHHNDVEIAKRFASELGLHSVGHFLDITRIQWGSEVPSTIHTALERSSHIVVMISPGSVTSSWVAYEIGFARGSGKRIVPYLLHPSMQMPSFLLQLHHLRTVRDASLFIEELQRYRRIPVNPNTFPELPRST